MQIYLAAYTGNTHLRKLKDINLPREMLKHYALHILMSKGNYKQGGKTLIGKFSCGIISQRIPK